MEKFLKYVEPGFDLMARAEQFVLERAGDCRDIAEVASDFTDLRDSGFDIREGKRRVAGFILSPGVRLGDREQEIFAIARVLDKYSSDRSGADQ